MKIDRTARQVLVAGAAVLLLLGCTTAPEAPASESAEPVTDGAFTLYSGRSEELVQPLIDLFEEQSGVRVDVRYGDTAELGALLLEEGSRTPAQVFLSQDAGALGALAEAGLFTTLPAAVTEQVPAGFTSTDGSWVGVTGRARVIVFDSAALAADELPEQVSELADPEWSGRVAIAPSNASFQSFITAYRVIEGEAPAEEWVAAIAAHDPQIFENNGAILQAVNEGVAEVGLINHYYWYRLAAEQGAESMRAQLFFPAAGDPGSIVNVTGAGILASAAADADALQFLEFLLSPVAQQYFVDETFEYPLVAGIAAPEGLPELQSLRNASLDLSDLRSLEETQALLAAHGLI